MHEYVKHAGLALAVVVIAGGLSACKEEKAQKTDTSAPALQQQSRSDLKSGFGTDATGTVKPAGTEASTESASGGLTDAMDSALGDTSMEITTGSVKPADDSQKGDAGADVATAPPPAGDGEAIAAKPDEALSEDERFAAELAREAEKEETETQAAKKGESR